jgi:hypothetical protein
MRGEIFSGRSSDLSDFIFSGFKSCVWDETQPTGRFYRSDTAFGIQFSIDVRITKASGRK